MTIVEFLRARLDEDSDYANSAFCHDPDRWAREVEAKRDIVDEAAYWFEQTHCEDVDSFARHALESLASVYSDHPDFDDNWWDTP